MRDAIDYLDRGKCDGFNFSHFTEMLEEKEGISSLEGVNGYLHSVFLPKYNKKFTRKTKLEEIGYRPIPEGMDLDQIFSIKEERPVHRHR